MWTLYTSLNFGRNTKIALCARFLNWISYEKKWVMLEKNHVFFFLYKKKNEYIKWNWTELTHPSCQICIRLFECVPQVFLVLRIFTITKLFLLALTQTFRLLSHFLEYMLFALMIFVLAARLQIQFINTIINGQRVGERERLVASRKRIELFFFLANSPPIL